MLWYFVGLTIFDFVLGLVPNVNLDSVDGFIDSSLQLKNIFAWANCFIPTEIIVFLLGLTGTMIFSKFFYRLISSVVSNVK